MIRNKVIQILVVVFLAVHLILLTGCNNLDEENYHKLKAGMDYDEVVSLLGKADKCDAAFGLKKCIWGNDKKYIRVNFAGDIVMGFSGKGL